MIIKMEQRFKIKSSPIAHNESIVQGDKYRFTILTSQLIRVEYNEKGIFEDRPTQIVLNRNFEVPKYKVIESDKELEIITENIHLRYTKEKPSKNSLKIEVTGGISSYHSVWHYGEELETLGGTARTLDHADGAIPLGNGLMSKLGFSIINDSQSIVLTEDGWVEPRNEEGIDFYFVGYGRDYIKCLQDFYYLTGKTPLLPRYALGNWWSRYYKYDEESYKELINRFKQEEIPFSVAIIDMDWHLVDIEKRFGSGWTGYTWNKELFSNPARFMNWLHEQGMAVSLNVHPADGIKPHEEMYEDMAKELNIDYKNEETIGFDFTSKAFIEAYFNYLHHPNEDDGVDFWWVDWQSGSISKVKGMDPLWMLNHFHYLDIKRKGKRPLTFSRYVGLGSHRYPIGFSGDTIISWDSLDFQPYFTATASNVGYGWWSHDIGGHMFGYRDNELALRWVQFGVFSPIMRLHSFKSPFVGKEPWNYDLVTETVMKEYLRLRHQMIPYLYSMNYVNYLKDSPLIQPMYYKNPWDEEAYEVQNQYYYGTELIAAPITTKIDQVTRKGHVTTWLPEGLWFDFFNGRIYEGNRKINMYRGLDSMPVLAKAGGIVPLDAEIKNSTSNPENMIIRIFPGADNTFTLYEDDGGLTNGDDLNYATIELTNSWNSEETTLEFTIHPTKGDLSSLPTERAYQLEFIGLRDTESYEVHINEQRFEIQPLYVENKIVFDLPQITHQSEVKVLIKDAQLKGNNYIQEAENFLNEAYFSIGGKDKIYNLIKNEKNAVKVMGELQTMNLTPEFLEALSEILWAYSK